MTSRSEVAAKARELSLSNFHVVAVDSACPSFFVLKVYLRLESALVCAIAKAVLAVVFATVAVDCAVLADVEAEVAVSLA